MTQCLVEKTSTLLGKDFTTYRIGGPLAEAYLPTSKNELISVLGMLYNQNRLNGVTILGWGGNSIIASAGISTPVIITRKLTATTQVNDTTFSFEAGTHLAKVSAEALKRNLTGAEFNIGIPGTVGGAIRMNAGAMGMETSDVLVSAEVFDYTTGQVNTLTNKDLAFSYRHSCIDPSKHCVLSGTYQFKTGDRDAIQAKMSENVGFRKQHHPIDPNGGSVFQNPNKENPAGKLLDALNAKSWTEGGVSISPLHANFIVNTGHADGTSGTSTDILKLMCRMKSEIKAHYGFDVHPENKFLGDATPQEQELWFTLTGEKI